MTKPETRPSGLLSGQVPPPDEAQAHFGFQEVPRARHAGLVGAVFNKVAKRYDLMNDLMSLGLHRLWKRAMIDWLSPKRYGNYLDVAGGTGDIARLIFRRLNGCAHITIADINEAMLNAGRAKSANASEKNSFAWLCANAESLPLPERSFDAYTIAFGIRNVTDIQAALREARRVLKPGGRFLCLEFSTVDIPGLDRLYDAYSFSAIPRLGQWVAGDADSYRYLVESIRRFPDQTDFAAMIERAGFAQVTYRNLSGGIVALHSAWRV